MCGEQPFGGRSVGLCQGSPPRVRGTVLHGKLRKMCIRITPACAGNRACLPGTASSMWDHPRVCGEQFLPDLPCKSRIGSPPRVRGTVCLRRGGHIPPGITPACAGNRQPRPARTTRPQDHPRVCGEQIKPRSHRRQQGGSPPRVRGTVQLLVAKLADSGSPPRVRGTGRHWARRRLLLRITPACAGNRDYQTPLTAGIEDHPRVCGEQDT